MQEPHFERRIPSCQELQSAVAPYGNPIPNSTLISQPITKLSFAKWLSRLAALWRTLKKLSQNFLDLALSIPFLKRLQAQGKAKVGKVIGSMEKGIAAAQIATPPTGSYEGVDLKIIPKYLSFRAALIRNQLTHQYVILVLSVLLVAHFVASRIEIYSLYGKLRVLNPCLIAMLQMRPWNTWVNWEI